MSVNKKSILSLRSLPKWWWQRLCDREKKFRLFLFFYCRLSEVVKNSGLLCRKVPLKLVLESVEVLFTTDQETIKTYLLCHFGIGCLQRGFMMNCLMMIQTIGRAMILVTMIRHTTTMIMRRIFNNSLHLALKLCLTL